MSHSLFLVRRHWTVGLGALVLLGLGAGRARAAQVVVMKTGARIEVTRAYDEGGKMRLELPGGGVLDVDPTAVKRVSNAASDMPGASGVFVRSSSGGGTSGRGDGMSASSGDAFDGGTPTGRGRAAVEARASGLLAIEPVAFKARTPGVRTLPDSNLDVFAPAPARGGLRTAALPSNSAPRATQAPANPANNPFTGGTVRRISGMSSRSAGGISTRESAVAGARSMGGVASLPRLK